MKRVSERLAGPRTILTWLALLFACAWVYQPGLAGPDLLDDRVNLRPLHLLDENPGQWVDVVVGNISGPLGRPLAMLSFSIEKLYIDGGAQGHKTVNLFIHLLTATLLLLFSRSLFAILALPRPSELALAVAAIWLFSPLLVSSVLYSVQRMAQLAALFVLLSQWGYLLMRVHTGWRAGIGILLLLTGLIAAPLSKENGFMAVPLLTLLEYQFLRFNGLSGVRLRLARYWHALVFFGALFGLLVSLGWQPECLFGGYAGRDFSLIERLMTEARILWYYLFQLLWTSPATLGIYQDGYLISRGLLTPAMTLLAVIAWLAVVIFLAWCIRSGRWVLAAYGASFFLVAHGMESTIFSLELYFEHRNYLPAMGICIALVGLLHQIWRRYCWLKVWLVSLVLLLCARSMVLTAAEAQLWSNSLLFHLTAIDRFPNSMRANTEYARHLALSGEVDSALVYSRRAQNMDNGDGLRHQLTNLTLACIAQSGVSAAPIAALQAQTADFRDDTASENMYLLVQYLVADQCPETDMVSLAVRLKTLTEVAPANVISAKMYLSLAIFENHLARYPQALEYVEALLLRSPGSVRALLMKLYFTAVLAMELEHQQVRKALESMDAQGLLNRQQQYNLSLFRAVGLSPDDEHLGELD